jgi:hypothetical protein
MCGIAGFISTALHPAAGARRQADDRMMSRGTQTAVF